VRVTQQMMSQSTLNNIEANMNRLDTLEGQITSGSQLTKPSDNPIATAQALSFQDGIGQTQQFLANIDQANEFLNATDSALSSVTSAIQRARELAVQAASDTTNSSDRQAIDAEVQQLQQQVLGLAQTQDGSTYLFAGTRSYAPGYTSSNPSTVAGAFQGNAGLVQRQVGPGQTIAVNVDATATFDPVFSALNTLHQGLTSSTTSTISSSIDQLDTALNSVLASRATVGAKMNRLTSQQTQMNSVETNLTGMLSQVKDVDIAQAITHFSMAQTVYQASLQAGAKVLQQSLLDYLR
jgi:flagellar hook-associated protein 3 FlgL